MAVRLTCTDNASGHDGLRWRMGPDSESVNEVIGETAPGVGELVVSDPITPEACFSVVAYAGSEESDAAKVCATTDPDATDWTQVSIGDEVEGGIYAGILTYGDGRSYHIVAGVSASQSQLPVKEDRTATPELLADADDGLSNTSIMVNDAKIHPAADYCDNYSRDDFSDWYMPAFNELGLIYSNLSEHPEFEALLQSDVPRLWASNQFPGDFSRHQALFFTTGASAGNYKDWATGPSVRPIRRIPT